MRCDLEASTICCLPECIGAGACQRIPVPAADAAPPRLDQAQVGGDHYSRLAITPWQALEVWLTAEEFRGYLKGEALVYLARERSKNGPQDVAKAAHVLAKLIEVDRKLAGGGA
jgi:hypothetical protein